MMRQDISFTSGSKQIACKGWFYTGSDDSSYPLIVMAHGLGGVKEMGLEAYAERFSAEGYPCLLFDYRHFGASGGSPRQIIDIKKQLEDWKSAIAYARQIEPARKVALWGSSFAGGHVLQTAGEDESIVSVIAQCPFTDGPATVKQLTFWTSIRLSVLAILDSIGSLIGRKPIMVRLAAPPSSLALMNAPGAFEGDKRLKEVAGPAAPPPYAAARISLHLAAYRPGRQLAKITCPVLLCLCLKDNIAPASAARDHARKAKDAKITNYDCGHFDIYLGEYFKDTIEDQVAFLNAHFSPGKVAPI